MADHSQDYVFYHKLITDNTYKSKAKKKSLFDDYPLKDIIKYNYFILCRISNKKRYEFVKFENYSYYARYIKNLDLMDISFNEVIFGNQRQKPHFVIDIRDEASLELDPNHNSIYRNKTINISNIVDIIVQELLDIVINGILKFIPCLDFNKDILIFSSHDEKTRRVHIIIDNYYHNNNKEAKELFNIINQDAPALYRSKRYLDSSVYKSIQQFRISDINLDFLFQGQKHTHIIEEIGNKYINSLASSLITNISYCNLFPGTNEVLIPKISSKTEYITHQSKGLLDLDSNTCKYCIESAINNLESYINHKDETTRLFKYRSHTNTFIAIDRNKTVDFKCLICDRCHKNDNPYILIKYYEQERKVYCYYMCHRDPTKKKIHYSDINIG
jgi:hypothetical protein